jgi:Ca2+-binding RTX toxin-like protein
MDNIIDFTVGVDRLVLSRTEFSALASRGINATDFIAGTAASHVMSGGLIYDRAQGNLYYDVDGHSVLTQVAHLSINSNLTVADFLLV